MKDEKKEQETTGQPAQFIGRDLLESYLYYRNYIPSNPVEAYNIKRICIEFGKELLPEYEDDGKQKEIDSLYNNACMVLKTEIPHKRQIKYKYLDKGNRVYELKAIDADNCEVVKDELEIVMNNFTNQQHEQHMEELQRVDNQIFHVLAEKDIVKKIKPTIDDILNKRIKERFDKGEK